MIALNDLPNEKLKLPNTSKKVVGRVLMEDIDSSTGKIKERLLGKNHVFKNAFNSSNWTRVLSNSARPNFFITDDSTPVCDSFPYLRGNIELWGQVNAGGDGARRGSWSPIDSFIDVDASVPPDFETGGASTIPAGMGRIWRYQYEFGEGQLHGRNLGCLGITPQYRPIQTQTTTAADHMALSPIRERYLRSWGVQTLNVSCVVRDGIRYSLEQSTAAAAGVVVVTKYNFLTHQSTRIDVSRYFTGLGAGQQRSVGVSFDDNRMYLAMISTAVAQRRVLEFSDDSFEDLIQTHLTPAITAGGTGTVLTFAGTGTTLSTAGGFAVLGTEMYEANQNGLSVANFATNSNWVLRTPVATCAYNSGVPNGVRSLTIENGIFYMHGVVGTAATRQGIFEVPGGKQVANIAPFTLGGQFLGAFREPSLEDPQFLYIGSNLAAPGTGQEHMTNSALAAYVIPEEMREIRPGYAKRITYQIEVMF